MILTLSLYREKSCDPTWNAQQNLGTRTHYVAPATLKFHKAKVLETYITDQGRFFALVESFRYYDGTRRRRFVIFDVAGQVVGDRSSEGWNTTSQARKAMWAELDKLDAEALTDEAIERAQRFLQHSVAHLRGELAEI